MWLVQGHGSDSLGREPHILITSYLGSSPLRFVQKPTPTALPREWKRPALESQTWVQILGLSCTDGVILSKSLITEPWFPYLSRERAGLFHSVINRYVLSIYWAPGAGSNGEAGPFLGELSLGVKAAVMIPVTTEEAQGAVGTRRRTPSTILIGGGGRRAGEESRNQLHRTP